MILAPSQRCFDIIMASEGDKLRAYPDPKTKAEPWTIGYGHTGKDVHSCLVWTQAQAVAALHSDVSHVAFSINHALGGKPTTQGQFDALCSLGFNVGAGKLLGSTLWRMHVAGNHDGAATQFALWDDKGTAVQHGLDIRRAKERALYLL
jgi:lysozyme